MSRITELGSSPEEDLLQTVVENLQILAEDKIYSGLYEETVISHSTAIQHDRDVVHEDHRGPRRSKIDKPPDIPLKRRLYADVLVLEPGEPTHIAHTPSNRDTIQPSENDYTIHKFQRNYQDTLIINQCLPENLSEASESEEEEFEELPRFRSRLAPVGLEARHSARAIRSGTLSGDEIEILRHCHEQSHGIVMLNELRDTIPKMEISKPGNSMFYETAFPWPHSETSPPNNRSNSSYENHDYFSLRNTLVIPVDEKNVTVEIEHYSTRTPTEEEDIADPIYSQPIKPKTKKISRDECDHILDKCNIGDFMLRRNKETTILSVKAHKKVKHVKLEFDRECVKVGKESFASLDEMVEFYRNSVPVSMTTEPVFLAREVLTRGLVK